MRGKPELEQSQIDLTCFGLQSRRIPGQTALTMSFYDGVGAPERVGEFLLNLGGYWQYSVVRYEDTGLQYELRTQSGKASRSVRVKRRVVLGVSAPMEYASFEECVKAASLVGVRV